MTEYEFSEEYNKIFSKLSQRMLMLGIVIAAGGVATMVNFMLDVSKILALIDGILYVLMAISFILPIDNFKKIVKTKGSDIKELMQAMKELDKGWLIVNITGVASRIVIFIIMLQGLGAF
ncbi:MAG: hypothetical protein ACFFCS_15610 [Candidatus Hodarchaeota archaeon]